MTDYVALADQTACGCLIGLRLATSEDEPFLYAVYASTRAAEMELVDWSESDKQAFLRLQFTAQHTYYQQHFPAATFRVVLCRDAMIGRLYVDRAPTEIRIIDIALLPEYRGHGIGTRLLRDVLAEAAREGKVVTIHVERFNPALGWYQRLGFEQIDDSGVYVLMRWSAGDQVKTAS